MTTTKALMIGLGVALATNIPVWRSGGRTGLTFWQFLFNHTIWGPPVEYIPEEDYMTALYPNLVDGVDVVIVDIDRYHCEVV